MSVTRFSPAILLIAAACVWALALALADKRTGLAGVVRRPAAERALVAAFAGPHRA